MPPSSASVGIEAQKQKQTGKRFKVAFFAAIAFFVLSNTVAYRIMNQVFLAFTGKTNEILSEAGFPTAKGMFLHTVAFFLVALVLMKEL